MRCVTRIIGGAALTILLAGGASAQKLEVGLKAGFNIPTLGGNDATNVSRLDLGTGGFFLTWNARPHFALQPEVLLKEYAASALIGTDTTDFRMTQVQVPVLFKALASIGPVVQGSVYAGPALGVLAQCLYTGNAPNISSGGPVSNVGCSGGDPVKTLEWSAVVGAGVGAKLSSNVRLVADARYDYGLSSLDGTGQGLDIKSRVFAFTLGASIPVGPARTTATVSAP